MLTITLALVTLTTGAASTLASSPGGEPHPTGLQATDMVPWNVTTQVHATVSDNYAVVDVTTHLTGNGTATEFPFQVRVPDDAFISGLTVVRDGLAHHAEIREKAAARTTYETSKSLGQDAGLVEAQRGTSTYTYLLNVAEATEVTARLTYERYLSAQEGVYTLPVVAPVPAAGADRGAELTVEVHHSDGLDGLWSTPPAPVHRTAEGLRLTTTLEAATPDKDRRLTAHYRLEDTPEGGSLVATVHNGTGYFAHRFRADQSPIGDQLPLDMVLVLDTSGSMRGQKIDQLRQAAGSVLSALGPIDRLNVVPFESTVQPAWEGLAPVNDSVKAHAHEVVDGLHAGGSTYIQGALTQGLGTFGEQADQERLPVMAFLTDGRPTRGETDTSRLRALAQEANRADARIFSMAFGPDADWNLVHGLAEDAGGTAIRVEEGQGAELDISQFLSGLTTPVFKDVTIEYHGPVAAYNATAPVLFAGSELLVLGTFEPTLLQLNATIQARTEDGPVTWERSHEVGQDDWATFLPRVVAYHRLQALQDRIDAQAGTDTEQLVAQATQLSLEHGFVTDYTSLVLALPDTHPDPVPETDPDLPSVDHTSPASAPSAGGGGGAAGAYDGGQDADGAAHGAYDGGDQAAPAADHTSQGHPDATARQDAQDAQQQAEEAKQAAEQATSTAQGAKDAAEDARDASQENGNELQATRDLLEEQENAQETPGPSLGLLLGLLVTLGIATRRRT